ncbi:putative nucleic acid-binding Zn ribbon protein [Staphylococcus auricularis]|uniref:ABC-2 transporter permease n=1 Tax=Staphylococcus auricularis TaxID=29379 RepID=A0AAP8PP65_9STAP|nr:ABC-2 transporter permease [Staphylococcus auricularis]MBM0867074.1 hypothetical protein [Staphylococcus auricularis]MCG7342061.1 ABC-2 transporter permease [Staphylococcus auricularis]MDC6327994.1 ABC-2 transporter permease [Staphylococcus auricularis]MDN4532069.1 ABC-2 transporter permease [Staphylococcus auricularis]PNZ67212.1 hypothetical protein CD158_06715 [Staphylococcus auricularis]
MKQLIIRNIKLRKTTLIVYGILLLLLPIYVWINSGAYKAINESQSQLSRLAIPIDIFIIIFSLLFTAAMTILIIKDAGHAFRFHSKLGDNKVYHFFASLPVSKKDMLNANYITVLLFTFIGAAIFGLYNVIGNQDNVTSQFTNSILLYIGINLFAVPLAFRQFTEKKSEKVSYIFYLITAFILIPIAISVIQLGIYVLYIFFGNGDALGINIYIDNAYLPYAYLIIGGLSFIINYFIQYRKLK